MKDWIHFKDEREKARQYREKMTKSAIMVQAWWRGMLVRRQLGPYKVAKKKGGKDDKKKKWWCKAFIVENKTIVITKNDLISVKYSVC